LERLPERSTIPKANGLVGRVVQALDYRGLYERFSGTTAQPVPMPYFQFGALPLDMSATPDNALFALPIPQRRLEELLERRAAELGVPIRRGHEVTGLTQTADQVNVDVLGPDGPYEMAARFLVGADGGRSAVRKLCGIGFPGVTDTGFVGRSGQVAIHAPVAVPGTGELDVAGVGRLRPATFNRTENGMFAFGMFQPGLYRVAAYEWGRPPVDEGEPMTVAELRDAVQRVVGGEVPMSEPPGGAPSALRRATESNSRQADRYREDGVFLVGDAAHVHSGVGGPGLNLGLQDVLNLGWKLAAAVKGHASDGLLDTYQSERHPVGARVIMSTRAQTALLSPGPNITALRQLFGELLTDANNVRRIADLMSGAEVHYDTHATGSPMVGRWMPDLALRKGNEAIRVAHLLRAGRPVLLDLADRTDLVDAAGDWKDRVDVVTATADPRSADAVLIRPDGYVAWAADGSTPGSADGLRQALRDWFGPAA
jgi:2-polyprenyl-6-methoxyphenol hydroxylase-like FAD-dependent oxidoreductase